MRMPERTTISRRFFSVLLAVMIACTPATASRAGEEEKQQADFDTLKSRFEEAYKNKDYEKALEISNQMIEIAAPRHYETLYNIACVHALRGDKAKAYQYLNWAIDAGFWDIMKLRKDEDFASLREEKYFKELSRSAWANGYLSMLERPQREEYQRRLRAEQLENVELVKVERDDPMLPPGGVDLILMVDVFHYIQDRPAYAKKLRDTRP